MCGVDFLLNFTGNSLPLKVEELLNRIERLEEQHKVTTSDIAMDRFAAQVRPVTKSIGGILCRTAEQVFLELLLMSSLAIE